MPIKSSASGVPAGTVAYFAANAVPAGWLKANGALVSRTAYARLFLAIGTTYGAGDGATTFNVPDCRGEFLRCLDDGRGVDAGRVIGSPQADDFKSHAHTIYHLKQAGYDTYWDGTSNSASGNDLQFFNESTTAAGGAETRPRNVAMLACIKY